MGGQHAHLNLLIPQGKMEGKPIIPPPQENLSSTCTTKPFNPPRKILVHHAHPNHLTVKNNKHLKADCCL